MTRVFYDTYRRHDVQSAPPAEMIALLLEKGATHIQKARHALHENHPEVCYEYCQKASTIIQALSKSLPEIPLEPDHKKLVLTLRQYYGMLLKLIRQILSQGDLESCEALLNSLLTMAKTWRKKSQEPFEKEEILRKEGGRIPMPVPNPLNVCT